MEIKKFKKQTNGMYKLQFDTFSVLLHEDLILKYNLLIKKDLTIEELDNIRDENNKYEAYNIGLKYIKTRLRSTTEIRKYLEKKAISDEDIDFTCNLLEKQGYLDDTLYATSYLHDKINMSYDGPLKIKKYLIENMIDDKIIASTLKEFTSELEDERVKKIISKISKTNKNKSSNSLKLKLKQQLINLGYNLDVINNNLIDFKIDDSLLREKEYEKIKKQLMKKYSGKELEYKIKQKMYQKGFFNM